MTITTTTAATTIPTTLSKDSAKSFCIASGAKRLPVSSAREQIWKWGVDESLWNPDRSRYAGRPPPLPGCEGHQGNSDEGKFDLMERVKRADEWFEKCFDMTEEEKKQEKRAVDAFLKNLEPLDDDLLDEINF